jgi:hypothetical protein
MTIRDLLVLSSSRSDCVVEWVEGKVREGGRAVPGRRLGFGEEGEGVRKREREGGGLLIITSPLSSSSLPQYECTFSQSHTISVDGSGRPNNCKSWRWSRAIFFQARPHFSRTAEAGISLSNFFRTILSARIYIWLP